MIKQERDTNADGSLAPGTSADQEINVGHEHNRRWRRWGGPRVVMVSFIAILIAAAMVYRLWPQHAAEEEAEAVVVSVQTAKAEHQPLSAQSVALGTIFPKQQATISAKISAPIAQMQLLKNKVVAAGAPIAVLESRDLQAQRTEAAAALDEARGALRALSSGAIPQGNAQAEKDLRDAQAMVENTRAILERRRVLFERGGISKKELEAAQLAFTTAEDQLRLAESTVNLRRVAINPNDRAQAELKIRQAEERLANLAAQVSYATIVAPFTGVITDQFQYKGEFAAAGARLVTLADLSEVIVKAPFPDTVAAQLHVGDMATVNPTDLPGEQFHGRVSLVSRASDPANRSVEIWVSLDNRQGRLRANGAAQVVVATKVVAAALVVPAAAVTLEASNANEGTVMVVDDKSIAHETKVVIGVRTSDRIEIVSGLKGGETVVVEGAYALPDGAKVQVNAPEKAGDANDDKDAPEPKEEKKDAGAAPEGEAKPKPGAKS